MADRINGLYVGTSRRGSVHPCTVGMSKLEALACLLLLASVRRNLGAASWGRDGRWGENGG